MRYRLTVSLFGKVVRDVTSGTIVKQYDTACPDETVVKIV
jgi:hypothetical protein